MCGIFYHVINTLHNQTNLRAFPIQLWNKSEANTIILETCRRSNQQNSLQLKMKTSTQLNNTTVSSLFSSEMGTITNNVMNSCILKKYYTILYILQYIDDLEIKSVIILFFSLYFIISPVLLDKSKHFTASTMLNQQLNQIKY